MCIYQSDKIYRLVKDDNDDFSCMKKPPLLKNRNERTTFVKAIISNPKLTSSQILAKKYVKDTLKSPRTLDTLKKLTDVKSINNSIDIQKLKKTRKDTAKMRKRRRRRRSKRKHRRKPKNYYKKKNILKRHRSQVDKSQFLLSIGHPISEIMPSKLRQTRETIKNKFHLSKRQDPNADINKSPEISPNSLDYGYNDQNLQISTDDIILLDDYKLPQLSDKKTIDTYSFNRKPDKYYSHNEQSQNSQNQYQNYENNGLINTRAIQSFENEITTQTNLIINNTTVKQINHQIITSPKIETEIKKKNNTTAVETKQVANEILNEIIEELEEFKIDHNNNNHRDGLPCKISGLWITSKAGVELNIKVKNHTLNVSIEKYHNIDNANEIKIINNTWNITGHVAFKRGAPFYLIASNNHAKSLAAFVGVCKICQGVDTIEGVWTVIHEPHSCRDFQISTSIHNDIFRRAKIHEFNKSKHKNTLGKYNETLDE